MEKTLTHCQGNHEAAGRDPGRRWHRSPVFPCSSSCAPSIGGCHFYFFHFCDHQVCYSAFLLSLHSSFEPSAMFSTSPRLQLIASETPEGFQSLALFSETPKPVFLCVYKSIENLWISWSVQKAASLNNHFHPPCYLHTFNKLQTYVPKKYPSLPLYSGVVQHA